MGTYTMKISLVFVLWIYGNTVTDGLSNDNIQITGPEPFITDGSRNLTLTCLATDADPGTVYSWDVTCVNYIQHSGNCTVTPRLDQDNTTIFCTAIHKDQTSHARYTLNLTYPPPAAPVITSSRPGQILQDGDTVTCTVTGGKPPVANVTLSCTNPNVTSKSTTVFTDGSASSSVTVNITGAIDDGMECTCNATWQPEPGLYTLNNVTTFWTEYRAILTNFNIDGIQDELLITEDEQRNVPIECSVYGRPAPNIILFKNGMEVQRNTINSVFDFNQTVSHTLTPAKCEDFGNYTCFTNGSRMNADLESVRLNVTCKPRHRGSVPWRLDKNGFTLSIVANPPLARDSVRVDSEGTNVSHWFKLRQTQKTLVETTLFVSAADFWTLAVGVYQLNVANAEGKFVIQFEVIQLLLSAFIALVIPAVVGVVANVCVIAETKRRNQAFTVAWWSLVVLVAVAAVFVLTAVIAAAVAKGQIPLPVFALLIPATAIQIIPLCFVVSKARRTKCNTSGRPEVYWWIYLVVAVAAVAVLVAAVVVAVDKHDDISMHPVSFRIVIGFVIVLHGVNYGPFAIAVFMWRKPNTRIGRSNPAFQINDQQPNLHDYTLDTATNDTKDGGSDPGYASTSEITTTPLKGQASTTAPTSDRDQFGYSCPRDQITAGDSQSRKASGVPFYAKPGVGNTSVAMRDGENRQPGPHVSTISIAPNGDVYNVVSKRAMGDNTAGVRNKEPVGTKRTDVPLGEDNYDHLTNKVRQTPAAAQGDPQYSHTGQF